MVDSGVQEANIGNILEEHRQFWLENGRFYSKAFESYNYDWTEFGKYIQELLDDAFKDGRMSEREYQEGLRYDEECKFRLYGEP